MIVKTIKMIRTDRKNIITDFCKDKCVKNFILRFNNKKG